MWQKLPDWKGLAAADLVCKEQDGLFRGPIKEVKFDETNKIFTIKTTWVGEYNPVSMRWVRKILSLSEDSGEYGINIYTDQSRPDDIEGITDSGFIRIWGADNKVFAYLVPHTYSQLRFEDLD